MRESNMKSVIFVAFFINSCLAFEQCYNKTGLCLGHLIGVFESIDGTEEFNSITDCVAKCNKVQNCKFASFHSTAKTCTLSKSCSKIVLKNSSYKYYNMRCSHKILTIGGTYQHSNGTNSLPEPNIEITSLTSDTNCNKIPENECGRFVKGIHGMVDNKFTICGGHEFITNEVTDSCYQYNRSLICHYHL